MDIFHERNQYFGGQRVKFTCCFQCIGPPKKIEIKSIVTILVGFYFSYPLVIKHGNGPCHICTVDDFAINTPLIEEFHLHSIIQLPCLMTPDN